MKEENQTSQKLQKVLAQYGLGSRREIESWITDKRVKVNSKVAHIGQRVEPFDKIEVDGVKLDLDEFSLKTEVLLYHKPEGEICTSDDPEGRTTVFEDLPAPKTGKWVSVGRLDYATSGLLIFTNDGELANKLMHPSSNIEREYAVRIFGAVEAEHIQGLLDGVSLDGKKARFDAISDPQGEGKNRWRHVILSEGRNREVRRLWESFGYTVNRLIRVRFGKIKLPPQLKVGEHRKATSQELDQLRSMVR